MNKAMNPASMNVLIKKCLVREFIFTDNKFSCTAEGQHGFCQGRSCATQLVTMYHDWSSILDQQPSPRIDAVFLDFSKAFDKVSHSLLLSKLHRYGICGQMLKWFTSYLYGRIQRVQYSGKFSDWITVNSGVQGSILGPLLFNIHVLDLPSFVSSAIPQYADDTVLDTGCPRMFYTVFQKNIKNIK